MTNTPPEALRVAANLLDEWAAYKDDFVLNRAFVEICAVHDALFEALKNRPQFAEVLRMRTEQLRGLIGG